MLCQILKCSNKNCNNKFIRKYPSQKYCSDECKRIAINIRRRERRYEKNNFIPHMSKCANCNRDFFKKAIKHIYCSERCRKKAYYAYNEASIKKRKRNIKKVISKEDFKRRLFKDITN